MRCPTAAHVWVASSSVPSPAHLLASFSPSSRSSGGVASSYSSSAAPPPLEEGCGLSKLNMSPVTTKGGQEVSQHVPNTVLLYRRAIYSRTDEGPGAGLRRTYGAEGARCVAWRVDGPREYRGARPVPEAQVIPAGHGHHARQSTRALCLTDVTTASLCCK